MKMSNLLASGWRGTSLTPLSALDIALVSTKQMVKLLRQIRWCNTALLQGNKPGANVLLSRPSAAQIQALVLHDQGRMLTLRPGDI